MSWRLHPLPAEVLSGLSPTTRRALSGEPVPAATPVLRELPRDARRGAAFADPEFARERREALKRMDAPVASLEAWARLDRGEATAVVTGQQPGLLVGPAMTLLKVMGAVAVAEAMTRQGNPAVAVYWCGADDSDFAETRATWIWSAGHELYEASLPSSLWRAGRRVGDLRGAELAGRERAALARQGAGSGTRHLHSILESIDSDLDFGERTQAWLMKLLAGRPLVTVDARSSRLRELGRDLFDAYAARHAESFDALLERTRTLREAGWTVPLAEAALRSGLFELQDGRRRKLDPEELTRGVSGRDLAPSVMLRPVWQDAMLAPVASILGPAELAYHTQLVPLYETLGVTAAAPTPRPHLTDWPRDLPWPEDASVLKDLLAGGAAANQALSRQATPPAWLQALEHATTERERSRRGLESALEGESPRSWGEQDRELHRRWRADLEVTALRRAQRKSAVWEWGPRWLSPRGVPQERLLNATTGFWRWGEEFDAILNRLADDYVASLRSQTSPAFAVVEDPAN